MLNDASLPQNTPNLQVPLHLLSPYHFSNGDMLLAIGAKHRCTREEIVSGNELAALTRIIDAVMRAASQPADRATPFMWTPGPIEIVIPRDLAGEDLFLAEQFIARLRDGLPQLEAEVVEKLIKTLADAYRWESGKGSAPEPKIPADACAELDHTWVESYMVYRWTTRERGAPISARDLAKLAAQHFSIEEDDSLPFWVIAEDVMRFYPDTARSMQSDGGEEDA